MKSKCIHTESACKLAFSAPSLQWHYLISSLSHNTNSHRLQVTCSLRLTGRDEGKWLDNSPVLWITKCKPAKTWLANLPAMITCAQGLFLFIYLFWRQPMDPCDMCELQFVTHTFFVVNTNNRFWQRRACKVCECVCACVCKGWFCPP